MAYITLNAGKLKENYRHLDRLFKSHTDQVVGGQQALKRKPDRT